ncbi:MAG: GNAT family N-acetyltransferase [Chitinophagaceae bacterium]|nr:GNAT family N-acetyltransferase [Chitinophagaceae bacterium]
MIITIRNDRYIRFRLLEQADAGKLIVYFDSLSDETRSRFGPHPFDEATVYQFCQHPDNTIKRYIAIEPSEEKIIAYMLLRKGMTEGDHQRYAARNQFFDQHNIVTFAPSVADRWQSSGIGSAMYNCIENELRSKGVKQIVLWGGVQATNEKAVGFYKKHGYRLAGSFWHDEKDNYDMVKWL